jgi:hypothetical protein
MEARTMVGAFILLLGVFVALAFGTYKAFSD